MRRHPGAGFALGGGDFDFRHHLGDLAAHLNGIGAAFHGGEIEPLVRGDQIDDAGPAARPIQATLKQHVRERTCIYRRCGIEIDLPLKHLLFPFLIFCRTVRARLLSTVETSRYSPPPFAGVLGSS